MVKYGPMIYNCYSKVHVYKILKLNFGFEKYLDILPVKQRKNLIKFVNQTIPAVYMLTFSGEIR